jgi:hypothetical protein
MFIMNHDVIYQFVLRLKAIRDKACPVDFFPQTVRGAVRLLLDAQFIRSLRLSLKWCSMETSELYLSRVGFFLRKSGRLRQPLHQG